MKAVCFFQGFLHILHKRNSTDLSAQIKKTMLGKKNQISVVELSLGVKRMNMKKLREELKIMSVNQLSVYQIINNASIIRTPSKKNEN